MAKNRRDFDSNAESTSYNTVFVDTSLDTHLVLTVSSSDTVYDFKGKPFSFFFFFFNSKIYDMDMYVNLSDG